MKQGLKRFRRMATACAAGTIALSVISVLGISSVASAAVVTPVGSNIVAASAPNVAPTAINSPAGNLTINLAAGTTWNIGDSINVTVQPHTGAGTVLFAGAPVVTANTGAGDQALCGTGFPLPPCGIVGLGTNSISLVLTGGVSQTTPTVSPESLVISGIGYTTTAAAPGFVLITSTTPNIATSTASSNAVVATPPSVSLFATTTPNIAPGATSAAGAWVMPLNTNGTTWAAGDKIYIGIARNNATNCETAGTPDSVGFSAVPTVTSVAALNGATVVPTVTASLASMGSCSTFSGINNVLVLTFTNSGTIGTGATADSFGHGYAAEFTIFNVSYTTSADASNLGFVDVANTYNVKPVFTTTAQPNDTLNGGSTTPAFPLAAFPGGPSNANITNTSVTVVANKPSVTIQANVTSTGAQATNQAVSNITITEGGPGALGSGVTGYACVSMSGANEWNASTHTPTATLGGGFAAGTVPVTLETTGTQTGAGTLEFQIPTASVGTPGTVTLSGLAVNLNTTGGPFALTAGFFYGGTNSVCAGTTPASANPFKIADLEGRIFGQTQDATAAQIAKVYPPACLAGVPNGILNTPATPTGTETAAVLVTNGSYQDALSASYLAGQLGTSVLTTPTNSVSQDALNSLRINGVTEVFVVGGPLVVSQADVTQLQNTPAFNCGGINQRTTVDGQPVDLVVQQIFGQTADGTAAAVATFPGAGVPGTGHFPGAYGGSLNDTTGSSGSPASSAPDTNVTTAILATDQSFTDAASASAIAQTSHFPLLLTSPSSLAPEAATALTNDAVQQVIVMGGPIAISDNVVSQVQAMGISVLRVAGQDFTDTSQLLAQFELNSINFLTSVTNGLDYSRPSGAAAFVTIARGDYYTDAIVSARAGQVFGGVPILLTWDPNNEGNPSGTNYLGTFLHTIGQVFPDTGTPTDPTINTLLLVGGPFAISNALAGTLGTSLNG